MYCTLKQITELKQDTGPQDLAEFICNVIKNRSFYEVRGSDWVIYSQATNLNDTLAEDLVYESVGNYITLMDYIDEHQRPMWKGDQEMIENRIQYLYDNDFLF